MALTCYASGPIGPLVLPGHNTLDPMSFFVLPLAPTGCCHARDSYAQNTVWGKDTAL